MLESLGHSVSGYGRPDDVLASDDPGLADFDLRELRNAIREAVGT